MNLPYDSIIWQHHHVFQHQDVLEPLHSANNWLLKSKKFTKLVHWDWDYRRENIRTFLPTQRTHYLPPYPYWIFYRYPMTYQPKKQPTYNVLRSSKYRNLQSERRIGLMYWDREYKRENIRSFQMEQPFQYNLLNINYHKCHHHIITKDQEAAILLCISKYQIIESKGGMGLLNCTNGCTRTKNE